MPNAVAEPHSAVSVATASPAVNRLQILIADAAYEGVDVLQDRYAPVITRAVADATRQLLNARPSIVVTELVLPDGDGAEICRTAKALPCPPLVIVTTATPERVPGALIAGCNAVLLKPYAPNLLCTRIGRLRQLSERAGAMHRVRHREDIAVALYAAASVTTNQVWNDIQCPRCGRPGATGFDFASHRRMWCACLGCEHVWVNRRRE
jgi:CheY-like chemotaxis protein